MGLIRRLSDAIRNNNRLVVRQELNNNLSLSPLCSTAENVFSQALPLVDEMTTVFPYGVGRNHARLDERRTPELTILKAPNEQMGWDEFANLMFMGWLTESELNVHVWKDRRGNVSGYSVLPPNSKQYDGKGGYYFQTFDEDGMHTLTRDEVMTLRFMRNPRNPNKGISPAGSVFTYTQVDDVVSQYIRAYFENGAIPASITFIRAGTRERYETARRELESNLHGAKNKHKTIYVWRQHLETGEEADQIEVKTIQGNNSTQALKEIVDIVNNRVNKAFGVSNFIMGDDASAKYDNAELSDRNFTKRRVYPALRKFWSQFQHELDRITGGLGYAIQFDLEIPELTDRLKIKTEISEKNVANLLSLIQNGAAPTATVKALGLNKDWLNVANGVYGRQLEQKDLDGALSIPEAVKQDEAPEPAECTHDLSFTGTFATGETTEKKVYDELIKIAKDIMAENPNLDYDRVVESIAEVLIDKANEGGVYGTKKVIEVADAEIATAVTAKLKSGVTVSKPYTDRLRERTDTLVKGYADYTHDVMRKALDENKNLTKTELKRKLMEVLPRERAELIARNETVYAFRSGQIDVDKQLANEYGLDMTLTWRAHLDGNTCPVCRAMDGTQTKIGQSFPDTATDDDGEMVAWEHSLWNDHGECPSAHANCRCFYEVEVERK